jgi:endonuclease/exonuclease/phosphatase family metal-dependent hydrolase
MAQSLRVVFVLFWMTSAVLAEDFVVAGYNLENYLRMDRRAKGEMVEDAPKPAHEIDSIVRILTQIHPDILGLMEIGGPDMLDDLQSRLKTAGLDLPFRVWVKGADEERHVALLSRFPIAQDRSIDDVSFPLDGRIQHMPRGILDATVQVTPSYQIRLIGAHLKSKRPVPDYNETRLREEESRHLRDHVEDILQKEPSTNLLLFGDLNDTKNEYPIRQIMGTPHTPTALRDIWLRDSRGETWTQYWKAADLYSRIDYILVSPALMPEIIWKKCGINDSPSWNEASDHRAVYATISSTDRR